MFSIFFILLLSLTTTDSIMAGSGETDRTNTKLFFSQEVCLCFVPQSVALLLQLLQTIDSTTPRDERGDLLVFLSGMGDILAVSEGVREYVERESPRWWVVLMLHSSLSVEEQDKVR